MNTTTELTTLEQLGPDDLTAAEWREHALGYQRAMQLWADNYHKSNDLHHIRNERVIDVLRDARNVAREAAAKDSASTLQGYALGLSAALVLLCNTIGADA